MEIKQLSSAEISELRDWLFAQDSDAWDRQIVSHANSGRLDALFAKAEADHSGEKSRRL